LVLSPQVTAVTGPTFDDGSGPFRFDYDPGAIRYGEGAVASLGEDLATLGYDRALLVTGTTVGATDAVMDPIRAGLGERHAGTLAETTPDKRLATAVEGTDRVRDVDADVLVAVGGGSSIDVAKATATVARRNDDPEALGAEFEATGTLDVPDDALPVVSVPTTLAGADFTQGAGLSAVPPGGLVDDVIGGGLSDPAIAPIEAVYDPAVVATTPRSILAGSAMNGFDKALESLYSRHASAITDATAARGLRRFREGLLAFGDASQGGDAAGDDYRDGLPAAVEGLLLAQYAITRADCGTMSVIHAFGQAVSSAGDVQQGVAHAICAPHALAAILDEDGVRTGLLAKALGAPDAPDRDAAVVDAVFEVRDALGVTTRLRDVDGLERSALSEVAATVADHAYLANGPAGYEPTAEELTAVLERAW
jgi:alcohol dehydrogenase class IV